VSCEACMLLLVRLGLSMSVCTHSGMVDRWVYRIVKAVMG
jgi:hypothetical protein